MARIEEELERLAAELRRLTAEYTQYFSGIRALPPADTEWRMSQLLKHLSAGSSEMTSAQRFRYDNLALTYAKYQEMWRKRVKQREEGAARVRPRAKARP